MRKLEKVVDARLKFKEKNNQWPKSLEEISFTENKIKAPFYAVKSASTFLDNETCPVRFKYIGDPLFNDLDCDLVFCETTPKGPPYKKVRTGNHGYSWYKFCYY